MATLILLVFAFVLFIVSGLLAVEPWRWRMLTWGLAAWVLSLILSQAGPLLR